MLGQVFELSDLPRVGALALIELVLSADNAIVLGLLVHTLPVSQHRKALLIGLFSAIFLRAAALFAVSFILQSVWLEVLGAVYLLYLSANHFLRKSSPKKAPTQALFWKTVLLIEFYDLAFAVDSIIAGVAFIATPQPTPAGSVHPKLWIVYVGGMMGVVAIRYAADFFSQLIHKFKNLEHSAYLLVALIGIKLLLGALFPVLTSIEFIFWILFLLVLASGFFKIKLR